MPPRSTVLPLSLLLLGSTAFAQTTSAPAAPPPKSGVTIQTRTNLVVVDVVVTDHSGKNVHGLQRSDFLLTEKGAPQQIRSFEEHSAPAQPADPPKPLDLPPGVFTNFTPAPASSALNILLLDSLNTPLQDQAYLRSQLLSYIRSAPAGNRIAIFGLTTRLILLQGFTANPQLLRSAIDKKSMRSSQILDNPTSGLPAEQLSRNIANSGADSNSDQLGTIARLQQFEAQTQSFQLQLRARYTLEAMGQLARYLSALPGRKNLIWFSGSFPLSVLPDGDLPDPFAVMGDMSGEFRDTANLLTRSQVSVYPVDARGLFNAPMYDVSEPGARYASNPQAFGADLQKFSQQTAEEHATMLQMAEQTGGRAFINTNGLSKAVETAISTGANYYTITYSPSNTRYDGAFRRIGVKLGARLAPENLSLAYRRGYFAVDPNAPAARPTQVAGPVPASPSLAPPPPNVIRAAMMRGAPEPTQIIFKALVLPATPPSSAPEDNLAPDTRANPDSKLAHGPYRRYTVDTAALASQLLLVRQSNGDSTGAVEFVVNAYDADGTLITATSGSARLNVKAENLARLSGSGVPFHQVISVPASGDFYLRVGVHDLVSNRVGAVEVPISSIKGLAPAPLPGATPDAVTTPHP